MGKSLIELNFAADSGIGPVNSHRPVLVEVVAWAAGNGGRSENADYRCGKRRLRRIDGRIRFLMKRIKAPEVVESAPFVTEAEFREFLNLAIRHWKFVSPVPGGTNLFISTHPQFFRHAAGAVGPIMYGSRPCPRKRTGKTAVITDEFQERSSAARNHPVGLAMRRFSTLAAASS